MYNFLKLQDQLAFISEMPLILLNAQFKYSRYITIHSQLITSACRSFPLFSGFVLKSLLSKTLTHTHTPMINGRKRTEKGQHELSYGVVCNSPKALTKISVAFRNPGEEREIPESNFQGAKLSCFLRRSAERKSKQSHPCQPGRVAS